MSDWVKRFELTDKVALVTGASRGIGESICEVYADAGAHVIAVGRDEQALASVATLVEQCGSRCDPIICDLSDAAAVDSLARQVVESHGGVDILVNNAGIARVAPALELSMSDWDETFQVNLRSAFTLARALAPAMIEKGAGKIINISSQAGVVALEEHVAYSASKAALDAMTRGLMVEWARHNIQINSICPTVILTPMGLEVWGDEAKSGPMLERIPQGRFGHPVEVADLALFLASSASNLINGESIMLDGGYSAV